MDPETNFPDDSSEDPNHSRLFNPADLSDRIIKALYHIAVEADKHGPLPATSWVQPLWAAYDQYLDTGHALDAPERRMIIRVVSCMDDGRLRDDQPRVTRLQELLEEHGITLEMPAKRARPRTPVRAKAGPSARRSPELGRDPFRDQPRRWSPAGRPVGEVTGQLVRPLGSSGYGPLPIGLNRSHNQENEENATAMSPYKDIPVEVMPPDWVTEETDNDAWNRAETARLDRLDSISQQLLDSMQRVHRRNGLTHWAVVLMDDQDETDMARHYIQRRRTFHAWLSASEAENNLIFRVNMASMFRRWANRTRAIAPPAPTRDRFAVRNALQKMAHRLADVEAMRASAAALQRTNVLAPFSRALDRHAAALAFAASTAQTLRLYWVQRRFGAQAARLAQLRRDARVGNVWWSMCWGFRALRAAVGARMRERRERSARRIAWGRIRPVFRAKVAERVVERMGERAGAVADMQVRAERMFEQALGRRLVGRALGRMRVRAEEMARLRRSGGVGEVAWALRGVDRRIVDAAAEVVERRRLVVAFASASEALRNSDAVLAWREALRRRDGALGKVRAVAARRLSKVTAERAAALWAASAREKVAEREARAERARSAAAALAAAAAAASAVAAREYDGYYEEEDDEFDGPETPTAGAIIRRAMPHLPRTRLGAVSAAPTPNTATRTVTVGAAPNTPAPGTGRGTAAVPPGPVFPPATTRQQRVFQNAFRSTRDALEAGDARAVAAASPAARAMYTPAQLVLPQQQRFLPEATRSEPRPRSFAARLREEGYGDAPAAGAARWRPRDQAGGSRY
jgi:hypothetical protein